MTQQYQFSVFTPTNDLTYIEELHESLCAQSQSWEWVLLINGEASLNDLPASLRLDDRVKAYRAQTVGFKIGALKREAANYCTGEYLVEVDHDDRLDPNAFAILKHHIDLASKPDFLYSDFVNFFENGESDTYKNWNTYSVKYGDDTYTALSAPAVNSRNLYQIFYAPNHIRVWKRTFYIDLGGHDVNLNVCDDHDLLCRTYLNTDSMVHIPNPLYYYRLRNDRKNSYLLRNQEIQQTQQEIGNKYFYSLVAREAELRGLPMIDLGGAHNCPDGYESVDLVDLTDQGGLVDHVCDVTQGLPFEDNSVMVVRAVDFLEHIPQGTPVIELMNEIWRILAPGGFLFSSTPSTEGKGAFCDPTHVSFWNDLSFRYYCDPGFAKYVPAFKGQFEATRVWNTVRNSLPYINADIMKRIDTNGSTQTTPGQAWPNP